MMGITGVIALTAFILAGWCAWFGRCRLSEQLVCAGFACAAQIVLTELALGVAGRLTASNAVALNVAATVLVLLAAALRRRLRPVAVAAASPSPTGDLFSPALLVLLALAAGVLVWLVTAATLLPPRGIDDLTYHLPPLYRFVQTGRIGILPLELRESFAMPLGADLLFLWPLLLMQADQFVDAVQIVAALYGVAVLYALARRLDIERREAAFVALLFLFVPVVLGQAGSNYIDLIVADCWLLLIYAAVSLHRSGEFGHVLLAGWATGFALGAKYTQLPLVVALQPLLLVALQRHGDGGQVLRRYSAYLACTLPLAAYWYLRNFLVFGEPLYPFRITTAGLVGVPGTAMAGLLTNTGPTALADFIAQPLHALLWPLRDPGLGSLHGGFGVLFWALGVPALVYVAWRAIAAARAGDWLPGLLWLQVPIAIALYLATAKRDGMQFDQRYILAVTGLGLLALGVYLQALRREWPAAAAGLRALAVVAAVLGVVQLGAYQWPHYRVAAALADRAAGTATSPYRYYRESPGLLSHLSSSWDALDWLTRDGAGLDVYMALPYAGFWVTPGFGSQLQNRLVNLGPDDGAEPDAVVFAERLPDLRLYFVGRQLTPTTVRNSGRYELIVQTEIAQLWLARTALAQPGRRARLVEFYRRAFAADIDQLRAAARQLPRDTPVVTGSPAGPALKYLSLTGELPAPVLLVRPGAERGEALRQNLGRVITVDRPLLGYAARPVARASAGVLFIENRAP